MKVVVGTFNQEKALVGAFSVIVQLVVEPMDRFTALVNTLLLVLGYCVTVPAVASLTEFLDSRLAADREPEDPGGWFSSAAMWFLLLNCCRSLLHGPITGEQVVT